MRTKLPKAILYVTILLVVFWAYGYVSGTLQAPAVPRQGQMQLTKADGYDLATTAAYIQPKNWEYYPEQLYTPADFEQGVTMEPVIEGDKPMLTQYGTYRLRIQLPPGKVYAVSGQNFSQSQRLYIDGDLMGSVGAPGNSVESTAPGLKNYYYIFSSEKGELELVFQCANFHYAGGNPNRPLYIGEYQVIESLNVRRMFGNFVLLGVLLADTLFYLGMYLLFRERREFLCFAAICFAEMGFSFFTGDRPILDFIPGLSWRFVVTADNLLMVAVIVLFTVYIQLITLKPMGKYFWVSVYSASALFAVLVIFSEPIFYSAFLPIYQFIWMVGGVWMITRFGMSLKHATFDYALIFFGYALFWASSTFEVVRQILGGKELLRNLNDSAMMVFFILNMVALTIQYARTELRLSQALVKERELAESNQMLDRLNTMKTRFISDISHEMKTPLTVMSVNAQLAGRMLEKGKDAQEITPSLERITEESGRLSRMVSELLELGRLRESREEMEPVDIAPLLRQTAETYGPLAAKNNNRFVLDVPDTLPPVLGNRDMIAQVIINLVANSAAYTYDGSITLGAAQEGNAISVRVVDTGCGILPEKIDSLFERFGSREQNGGNGLGLSICKQIIEAHEGEITVDSTAGQGTAMVFTIPCLPQEKKGGPPPQADARGG